VFKMITDQVNERNVELNFEIFRRT